MTEKLRENTSRKDKKKKHQKAYCLARFESVSGAEGLE